MFDRCTGGVREDRHASGRSVRETGRQSSAPVCPRFTTTAICILQSALVYGTVMVRVRIDVLSSVPGDSVGVKMPGPVNPNASVVTELRPGVSREAVGKPGKPAT